MRHSLTARVHNLDDDIRNLRCRVNTLALFLLEDDFGISERSLEQLNLLMEQVGGVPRLAVDEVNGRFVMAREEV